MAEAPILIAGLDHVVLRVRDTDRMVAFYRDVLGCAVEREVTGASLIQMRAGASLIDLVTVSADGGAVAAGPGNMDHFCVRVLPFDETAIRRHLAFHGVDAGATERRYGAEGSGPSIYIQDPEGNTVELKGPPEA